MANEPKRNLGRGLSALLGEDETAGASSAGKGAASRTLRVDQLHPSRFQPRQNFPEDEMKALVESVVAQGILQPLLVRPHPEIAGAFEILAGERRWRAAQRARLHDVPVLVKEIADREALEIALVENIQRQDLTPLEEALGYKRLIDEFGRSHEALAMALGKSRSHVANMLRLLTLPDEVKAMLADGRLTMGHARTLVGSADALERAREIVQGGLSVREAERRAKRGGATAGKDASKAPRRSPDIVSLERELANLLGLKTALAYDGKSGTLTIHYKSLDQLDDVLKKLRRP